MKKDKSKPSIWLFLHRYRSKIALALFFVVLPIILLIAAYVSPLVQSQRVIFDQEITEESVTIRSFDRLEDVEDMTINFSWSSLTLPEEDDDGILFGGRYGFTMSYTLDAPYDISNVRVVISLQPRFTNIRDVSNEERLSSSSDRTIFVNHNVNYPINPLWFVTIEEPTVYIRIMYEKGLAGQLEPITVTEYVRVSLKDELPENVFVN